MKMYTYSGTCDGARRGPSGTSVARHQMAGMIKEETIMAENDEGSLLKKAKQVGEQVAQAAAEASRLKDVASHAVEDAVTEARRFAKRSRNAAEDLVDEAAHRIKRDPTTLGRHWLRDWPRCGHFDRIAGLTQ